MDLYNEGHTKNRSIDNVLDAVTVIVTLQRPFLAESCISHKKNSIGD